MSEKRLRIYLTGLLIVAAPFLNIFLVQNLNTLIWPYLWPRPIIFVLVGVFTVLMWQPTWFYGLWARRLIGATMIFVGECYVLHSLDVVINAFSILALIHFVGITGTFVVMLISYINQFKPRDQREAPSLPENLPHVAAIIPTYGEPVGILTETVKSLQELDYPADRLYILISDDGHREEVRWMAETYGVYYNAGARKDAKAGNLNSALCYLEKHWPQASLVLTQDADELIAPNFLKCTIGYFNDPQVAFVQTPKDAVAPTNDPFGVRDRVFYDVIQPGRNGSGAAFSCGSGVLWDITALKTVGGFATWNVVEDLTTSYLLHCAGYRSEYHNTILTIGLAPDDIPGLLKQRGTWAVDTWRLFLFKNPVLVNGLTLRQRMQYTELGLFYVTSTFFIPLMMLTPLLSLLTGQFVPIQGAALFPWVFITVLYYVVLARGNLEFFVRMWQYWIGHWPTYAKAFWIALRSRDEKPGYKVTRKTRQHGFYGALIWPQFLYLILGTIAIFHGMLALTNVHLMVRLANVGALLFFMYMVGGICNAAFFGLPLPDPVIRIVQQLSRIPRPAAIHIRGAQFGTDQPGI